MADFPLGASRATANATATAHCERIETHEYRGAEAAPYTEQTQIDCFGYAFSGAPRKLELLINEGELGFYWLLLDEANRAAITASMTQRFGAPTCVTADYTIFAGNQVAIRRDPPEVLVALPADFTAITGGC